MIEEQSGGYEGGEVSPNIFVPSTSSTAIAWPQGGTVPFVVTQTTGITAPPVVPEKPKSNRGRKPTPKDLPTARTADEYPIQTSQEYDALMRSASDAATERNWKRMPERQAIVHRSKGQPHYIQLQLQDNDEIGLEGLHAFIKGIDADCLLVLLYISSILCPDEALPRDTYKSVYIDLDDVASRTWPAPRSTKERLENRAKVWSYILYGARATVVGQRTVSYYRQSDDKEIPTVRDTPLWVLLERERPKDVTLSLWEQTEVPVRQEMILSKQWEDSLMNPETAQFLPLGEVLGSIPPDRPSGAWARAIGLSFANHWRRHVHECTNGKLTPTRKEILYHYMPKVGNPDLILNGKDPKRVMEHWYSALCWLRDKGFVSPGGDVPNGNTIPAHINTVIAKESLPHFGRVEAWLNNRTDVRPGKLMLPSVSQIADSKHMPKPQDLKRRRGAKNRKRTTAE